MRLGIPLEMPQITSYFWMLLLPYITAVDSSKQEIERHLELGKQLLSKGQFADALNHYHAALDADQDNYQALYWRATVYLAMGKSKAALPDLDKVVEVKPDFVAARMQRGNVLLKQGRLDLAAQDFSQVLSHEPQNQAAQTHLNDIQPIREDILAGDEYLANQDYDAAVAHYSRAIEICQWDSSLREKRADCYIQLNELGKALGDIRATTKLLQDSTEAYYKMAMITYDMGDAQESLTQTRECLKLNADHQRCFTHYKKVKKLVKQQEEMLAAMEKEDWLLCLEKWQSALKTEPKLEAIRLVLDQSACRCQGRAGHSQEAVQLCSSVIDNTKVESDKVLALCERADAWIMMDEFDKAISDFQAAKDLDNENRRANEGIQRTQKLQKQAAKRDYYKILGVPRSANKAQITKAYRKLAQEWHPDNFILDDEKAAAEKRFIDIAAAKEVLTDPEKREKFDHGEDPLDAEQQAQGQNPFGHGFNPFHHQGGGGNGGPFTFKFHFG